MLGLYQILRADRSWDRGLHQNPKGIPLNNQVQKLKLDTESAMLELDQILRANEMTVALVAAVPSFLIAGGTLYALARWLTPSPPDRRREGLPARSALQGFVFPLPWLSPLPPGGCRKALPTGWRSVLLLVVKGERVCGGGLRARETSIAA